MSYGMSPESLMDLAREHWREFTPKRYRRLKASGQLETELRAAANLTIAAMEDDRKAGFSPDEAWEMEREHYILTREEPSKSE